MWIKFKNQKELEDHICKLYDQGKIVTYVRDQYNFEVEFVDPLLNI